MCCNKRRKGGSCETTNPHFSPFHFIFLFCYKTGPLERKGELLFFLSTTTHTVPFSHSPGQKLAWVEVGILLLFPRPEKEREKYKWEQGRRAESASKLTGIWLRSARFFPLYVCAGQSLLLGKRKKNAVGFHSCAHELFARLTHTHVVELPGAITAAIKRDRIFNGSLGCELVRSFASCSWRGKKERE